MGVGLWEVGAAGGVLTAFALTPAGIYLSPGNSVLSGRASIQQPPMTSTFSEEKSC